VGPAHDVSSSGSRWDFYNCPESPHWPVVVSGFFLPAISIFLIILSGPAMHQVFLELSLFTTGFFLAFVRPQALGYVA
jgi:hypothetical protein